MFKEYAARSRRFLRLIAKSARGFSPKSVEIPKLIMLHVGRSGSTVLGDLIGQHPDIYWDKEVLMPVRIQHYANQVPFRQEILRDPVRIVQWRMLTVEKKGYGFETMPHQVEPFGLVMSEYVQRLRALGFQHAVVLERKNSLRLIISLLHAMRKGQWHNEQSAPIQVNKSPLFMHLDNVFGYGRSLQANLDYFADFYEKIYPTLEGYKILRLTYEDDIAPSPLIGYERVRELLDLPPSDNVSVRLKKLNPHGLSNMIDNFDEVERDLIGTRYEWMLYD